MSDCGHEPEPWSGAYGHWACQLPRGHRGQHRFNNYTWRRGARLSGGVRYAAQSVRLYIAKRLHLVRPWQVVIRRTSTTYAPCDLVALYEKTSAAAVSSSLADEKAET